MSHYYLVKGKVVIPNIVFVAVASWAIALLTTTIIGCILTVLWSGTGYDLLKALPRPLSLLLGLWGAYAALGAICLYVTMWIYWFGFERSAFLVRAGWLMALLLGLPYGALIYAIYIWRTGLTRMTSADTLFPNSAIR